MLKENERRPAGRRLPDFLNQIKVLSIEEGRRPAIGCRPARPGSRPAGRLTHRRQIADTRRRRASLVATFRPCERFTRPPSRPSTSAAGTAVAGSALQFKLKLCRLRKAQSRVRDPPQRRARAGRGTAAAVGARWAIAGSFRGRRDGDHGSGLGDLRGRTLW